MIRKKVISAVLAMLMLVSLATPCAMASDSHERLYVAIGNVVDDGNVNIKDATAVQKHLAGIITLSGMELLAADTNGDGEVNIKDATIIQKHIAGFPTNSSMGVVITLPQENPTTPDETEPVTEIIPTCTGCDIPVVTVPDNTESEKEQTDPTETPSTPDSSPRDIYFIVEDSMRVTYYEGCDTADTVLYLVKSLQELQQVLSGVKVTMYGDGTYTTPGIDPEYADKFFEEYALVVSLNCVGGSCCTQKIDRLSLEDKFLTIHRTIHHPLIMLCDMNWQYVLMKVKAEDVVSVEALYDISEIMEPEFTDPTEPEKEQTDPTYSTPPETTPKVDPTPAPTSEPATTEAPEYTTPVLNGNVPFSIVDEGRITDYIGSDQPRVLYADSVENAQDAFSQIILDPYYHGSYFLNPTLDEKYDEKYFEDKSLVISLNCVGGSNCHQSIDSLTVSGGVLTLHRTLYKPMIVTCDMNYQYVLIEVEKKDVGKITSTENHNTYYTIEDE